MKAGQTSRSNVFGGRLRSTEKYRFKTFSSADRVVSEDNRWSISSLPLVLEGGKSGRRTHTGKINFKKRLSPEKNEKKAQNEKDTVNHKQFGDRQQFSRTCLRGAMWTIHGTNG